MIASKLSSHVIPELKREDRCSQALGWMEIFRVCHLPVVEHGVYIGLLKDEAIYAHGNLEDPVSDVELHREGMFVYEDAHIYEVISVAASNLLSVVPVINRVGKYQGVILLCEIIQHLDNLMGINIPGGIIVLEVNKMDYSLAEIAQIVEYNEMKVLSCFVTGMPDSNKVDVTLKVNTMNIEPLLDTLARYRYTIKNTFVAGEEYGEELKERFGQLMKFMEM